MKLNRILTALVMGFLIAGTLFIFFTAHGLDLLQSGFDEGDSLEALETGWTCTVAETGESFATELPSLLPLPEGAKEITLTNTLPDDIASGSVIRLQTSLGWYKILIDGKERASYGNDEPTLAYLLENASAMPFCELTEQDAGATIEIVSGCLDPSQLALQRAPVIGEHRDLLASDLLQWSTGALIVFILLIISGIMALTWLVFRIKRESLPYLALSALFIFLGALYYNTGNFLGPELFGYPDVYFYANDALYYIAQVLLPLVGYLVILSSTEKHVSRALGAFLVAHVLCAAVCLVLQAVFVAHCVQIEAVPVTLSIIGYSWLLAEWKPWTATDGRRWFGLAVLPTLLGFLLDFFKCTSSGIGIPLPVNIAETLQAVMPFMVFIPFGMLVSMVLVFFGLASTLTEKRLQLARAAEAAKAQVVLAEKEYRSSLENIARIRRLRHDMSHHLSTLATLIEHEQDADALGYIRSITHELPDQVPSEHNFITSSFIEHYRAQCADEAIRFSSDITYDEDELEDKTRLGVLLGNALKNAYEAAAMCSEPTLRFIDIVGYRKNAQIVIIMRNGFTGAIDAAFRSTKAPDRGLGIASIRAATEGYGGYLELVYDEGIFTLKAVLTTRGPGEDLR